MWQEFEAAQLRQQDAVDRDTLQAWRVVQIYVKTMNDKRMPSLQSLLGAGKPKKPATRPWPTAAQQKAGLEAISRQYGIPMRPVTH